MINFDDHANENKTSGSGKTNALFNLTNNQPDIDKMYFYAKDSYQAKYQYLINKLEKVGLKHYDDPKASIEYSIDMQDVYKNIEEYNLGKKRKILIVFDDMIADMMNDNTHSQLKVPKDARLNSTHFFILKIPNKRELQQITLNYSSNIDFKDFIKICKKFIAEPHYFLVNDTTLSSDNPLRFR